jgi:hypothetical protein
MLVVYRNTLIGQSEIDNPQYDRTVTDTIYASEDQRYHAGLADGTHSYFVIDEIPATPGNRKFMDDVVRNRSQWYRVRVVPTAIAGDVPGAVMARDNGDGTTAVLRRLPREEWDAIYNQPEGGE